VKAAVSPMELNELRLVATLLTFVQEVAGSNLGRGTGQPELFLGFSHALEENIRSAHTQRPLPSTFLPVCYLDKLHNESYSENLEIKISWRHIAESSWSYFLLASASTIRAQW